MGFLNPIFLFGILAVAVPLFIHLWSRRQAKTVDFSSLMFLLVAHRQSVRRIQLKHLLILLLRMGIIILITVALARPLLKSPFLLADARAKASNVIILDNSYSMGYRGIQGERFEKARAIGREVIQSLRRGDSAALILMSDIPDAIFRKLTKDLEQVKVAIDEAQVSYRSTYVPSSLEMAHDILELSNEPNKEIYLISDFNQNGWDNWDRVPNRSGARIFLLPVGEEVGDNISIEEVRQSTQLIGINRPFQLGAKVGIHSEASLAETVVTLFIDGQKRQSMSPGLKDGQSESEHTEAALHQSITSAFAHRFESTGTHTGYLELTADRLIADNRRHFAVHVYGQIRVLCVGDQTLYLTLALNPETQLNPGVNYTILPTTCSAAAFDNFPLEDYDILILADLPTLSTPAQQQLQSFMRAGKSVIYFVNADIDLVAYNQFGEWLPASFGLPAAWGPPLTASEYQSDHPIFEVYQPSDFSGQYAPQFYRGLTLQPREQGQVIAQLSDGTPFLVERPIALGTALLFNVSVTDRYASTLLVNPLFLPLLQQTVLYAKAVQSPQQRTVLVGQPYVANYHQEGATTASVGHVEDVATPPETVTIAEDGTLTFSGTNSPGIYRIEVQSKNRRRRDFFAVNVDPTESHLRQIPIREATKRIDAQLDITTTPEMLSKTLIDYRVGKEIWGELLLIALVLMLVETLLSNRERAIPDDAVQARRTSS